MLKFEWTKEHTVALIYTCVTILLAIPLVLVILFPDILGGALGGLVNALSPSVLPWHICFSPSATFLRRRSAALSKRKNRARGCGALRQWC